MNRQTVVQLSLFEGMLDLLPSYVLCLIFKCLPPRDQISLCKTCRLFAKVLEKTLTINRICCYGSGISLHYVLDYGIEIVHSLNEVLVFKDSVIVAWCELKSARRFSCCMLADGSFLLFVFTYNKFCEAFRFAEKRAKLLNRWSLPYNILSVSSRCIASQLDQDTCFFSFLARPLVGESAQRGMVLCMGKKRNDVVFCSAVEGEDVAHAFPTMFRQINSAFMLNPLMMCWQNEVLVWDKSCSYVITYSLTRGKQQVHLLDSPPLHVFQGFVLVTKLAAFVVCNSKVQLRRALEPSEYVLFANRELIVARTEASPCCWISLKDDQVGHVEVAGVLHNVFYCEKDDLLIMCTSLRTLYCFGVHKSISQGKLDVLASTGVSQLSTRTHSVAGPFEVVQSDHFVAVRWRTGKVLIFFVDSLGQLKWSLPVPTFTKVSTPKGYSFPELFMSQKDKLVRFVFPTSIIVSQDQQEEEAGVPSSSIARLEEAARKLANSLSQLASMADADEHELAEPVMENIAGPREQGVRLALTEQVHVFSRKGKVWLVSNIDGRILSRVPFKLSTNNLRCFGCGQKTVLASVNIICFAEKSSKEQWKRIVLAGGVKNLEMVNERYCAVVRAQNMEIIDLETGHAKQINLGL